MTTIYTDEQIEDARRSGYAAGVQGRSLKCCIFPRGTTIRDAWIDGYRLAVFAPIPNVRLPSDRRTAA